MTARAKLYLSSFHGRRITFTTYYYLHTLCSARGFLSIIQRFKDRLSFHGQSAEANPSGGNNYRGLYNIGLKSLGAQQKQASAQVPMLAH